MCSKITKLFTTKQKYCLSCAAKLLNSSQGNKSIVYHVKAFVEDKMKSCLSDGFSKRRKSCIPSISHDVFNFLQYDRFNPFPHNDTF